jgi:acetate kinase
MNVLVLNSGSSSQKTCLYSMEDSPPCDPPTPVWEGKIEWGNEGAECSIKTSAGASRRTQLPPLSRSEAITQLLQTLWDGNTQVISGPGDIHIVGHRVVHGGLHCFEPALVTPELKSAIESVSAFVPLHNRAELDGMEIVEQLLGTVPQVAVFDTGFHHSIPLPAATYPGPYEWFEQGIRRYGFHGINHQYCAERAARMLGKDLASLKLVTCHLGNGCSLAAIQGGRSVDTTMGFTPLEGLMMGTRSGSVDPGILTYLVREKQLTGPQLDEILNQQSGLLGISGISSDMREILAACKRGHQRAQLALDIYTHRLLSGIGAMVAVLGGIDALVFTAGVGENSPEVRSFACKSLAFMGVALDPAENLSLRPEEELARDKDISAARSSVRVFVIHAQEDWMIARECWKLQTTARTPSNL